MLTEFWTQPLSHGVFGFVLRSSLALALGLILSVRWARSPKSVTTLWMVVALVVALLAVPIPGLPLRVGRNGSAVVSPQVYELGVSPVTRSFSGELRPDLLWLSLIGAAFCGLVVLGIRSLATWRIVRDADQCTDEGLLTELYGLGESLRLSEVPLLLMSDRVQSPCLLGLWNPVLILPSWNVLAGEDARIALGHELCHFASRDHWRISVFALLTSLLWWNPLVWLASRSFRSALEEACDQHAVERLKLDKASYARLLTSYQLRVASPVALRMWNRGSTLERVRQLQGTPTSPRTVSLLAFVPLLIPISVRPAFDRERIQGEISMDEVVFWSDRNGDNRLYRMWRDGSSQEAMSETFRGASVPSISPDGRSIAYVKGEGSGRDIYVARVDGSDEQKVVRSRWRDDQPMFSPDGSRLLFMTKTPNGWRIGTKELRSGGQAYLGNGGFQGYEARWHPSGNRILFSSDRAGNQNIWSVNIDGSDLVQLTFGKVEDTGAWYTGEGRYVIYTAHEPWEYNVFRLDLLSGETKRLTFDPAINTEARPILDGRGIVFTTHRTGEPQVAYMDTNGNDAVVLTSDGACGWAAVR